MVDPEFRPIPSAPGYSVSACGIVRGPKASALSVHMSRCGYRVASLWDRNTKKWRKVRVGRLVAEVWLPDFCCDKVVDHINRDRLDDRVENLRMATWVENARNRSRQSNNTSGHPGVVFDKHRKRWMARITVAGQHKHLGSFSDFEAAVAARRAAVARTFGAFSAEGRR